MSLSCTNGVWFLCFHSGYSIIQVNEKFFELIIIGIVEKVQ